MSDFMIAFRPIARRIERHVPKIQPEPAPPLPTFEEICEGAPAAIAYMRWELIHSMETAPPYIPSFVPSLFQTIFGLESRP